MNCTPCDLFLKGLCNPKKIKNLGMQCPEEVAKASREYSESQSKKGIIPPEYSNGRIPGAKTGGW